MLKKVTLFILLGIASLSGAALATASPVNELSAQEETVTPFYIPCDYYSSGQHQHVKVGSNSYSQSGGTHSYVITKPDGSQQGVNCAITNWYRYDTYACACGNSSYNGPASFTGTSHQYH